MHPPVVAFTAYSGVGKTTYLEKLIPCLKEAGVRVAVIKHDGHDFQADTPGKDSWRFAQAGAETVALVSSGKLALFRYRPAGLEELLKHITDADLILAEGYKHGPFPKIALYRSGSGKGLTVPAEECLAIVGDYPEPVACPVFPLEDPAPLARHLLRLMKAEILK